MRPRSAKRKVAGSTHNQALSALLFLYREVLGCGSEWGQEFVPAVRPARLPVVLTRQEVSAVLSRLPDPSRLVCELLYGGGLRLLEGLTLRVKDVDPARGEIRVRDGKGRKDRVTVLPRSVATRLRGHLEAVRQQHEADLRAGAGSVAPPDGLEVKYLNADANGRGTGCFPRRERTAMRGPVSAGGTICTRVWCSGPFAEPCSRLTSGSARPAIGCGSRSRRICRSRGTTSGPSRVSLGPERPTSRISLHRPAYPAGSRCFRRICCRSAVLHCGRRGAAGATPASH